MQPSEPPKKIKQPNTRWLTALLGLVLLIIGQFQLARTEIPDTTPTKIGVWLLDQLHLGIPSIDNVIRGLPILLAGVVLLFIALRGLRLLPAEGPFTGEAGILLRVLRTVWPWLAGAAGSFALLLWQINSFEYSGFMLIEWLLAPVLALTAFAIWDRQRQINLSPSLNRKDILWMLGLFTLSIVIGVYRLQGMPDMLIGDEGSFWTVARDIATGKYQPTVFANGVYTFPVLSSIGQAAILRVFGIGLWGWRFSSVFAGALTIFPLYLLARETFDRKVAILSGVALAFSPYFLAFARLGYNNIQAVFITTLALHLVYTGLQRSSFFYVFLAGCAIGLGFYTYFAARMTLVIIVLFIVVLWLARKLKFKYAVLNLVILVLGATLVLVPHLVFGNLHDTQGMSYKTLESLFFNIFNGEQFYSREELTAIAPLFKIGAGEFFYNPKIYLVLIGRGFLRTLLAFQKSGIITEHFIAFPLAGTIGVIFYLLGFGSMFKRIKEPRYLLFLIWFVVVITGLSALNTVPPRQTHMVNIIPLLALLIGLGINILVNSISAFNRLGERPRNVILGILIGIVVASGIYDYFVLVPRQYFPQPDQIASWTGFSATDEILVHVFVEGDNSPLMNVYSTTEFRSDIQYRTITFDQFQTTLQAYADGKKYIIFYLPSLTGQVEPLLSQTWGQAFIRREFFNHEGLPILSAGMNTPFVFERDQSFGAIIKESYFRLPLLIFLISCLSLIGVVAFIPQKWIDRFPIPIRAFAKWFNSPARPTESGTALGGITGDESLAFIETRTVSTEPPEWAKSTFANENPEPARRIKIDGKTARDKAGRDLYLRVHIPAITIKSGWQIFVPDFEIPAHVLLIVSLVSAIFAQILVFRQEFLFGILLYGVCAALLIVWARLHPRWMGVLTNHVHIQRKAEVVIAITLLLMVIFTRFYDLGYRVYGIEADESKWTVQAWYSAILQVDRGDFSTMHYQFLPVTFWVRSLFLRIFGLDFLSARIESATQSVIAVIFLYLLVRRLTSNPPIALLSASLYAFSYVELNASHQALHNTTIEPWMMASLYFLILAFQNKKHWAFQVTGVLLALGMLTYETFFPTVFVALTSIFGAAVWQIVKRQASIRRWLTRSLLVVWPIVIAYWFYTRDYLNQEQYHFGWMDQSANGGSLLINAINFIFHNVGLLIKTVFSEVVFDDALLRWHGSFVSQFILPFIVIGLVYNLLNLRRPYFLFIPLWYLLNVGAAPISVGAVWPRILYSSLGPLMVWGALGLCVGYGILRSALDTRKPHPSTLLFGFTVLTIFISNYSVFTNKIDDPTDRVQRRELADLTAASAKDVDLILFPFSPAQNDPVELESQVIIFSVAGEHDGSLEVDNDYAQVPFNELLVTLWEHQNIGSIDILYDKSRAAIDPERDIVLNTVLQCYPDAKLETAGEFFEVYRLDSTALTSPVCYQASTPTAVSPVNGATIPAGTPLTLEWTSIVESTRFSVTLQQRVPDIYWLEAEDVFASNGWYANSAFVTGFSGSGFLEDAWNSEETQYNLNIAQEGEYRIWVRTYKRRINDQYNFIIINGENFPFAGETTPLSRWIWEPIGTFNLQAGSTSLSLNRVYGQDEQYSVFIDAILVTSDLTASPEESQVWETVYNESELSSPASRITLDRAFGSGEYRWSVRVFDGNKLIDSQGELGIPMSFATFIIQP